MSSRWKLASLVALIAIVASAFIIAHRVHSKKKAIYLSGAVIRQDADPKKQIPIADVVVGAADGLAEGEFTSNSSGFFSVGLRKEVKPGQPVTLMFWHPGYKPLEVKATVGRGIYVARMVPVTQEAQEAVHRPEVAVGNVGVRYSVKSTAIENVGSVVKTFQVANTGSVPCNGQRPCSPDARWKAASGGISLDAGQGNQFRNSRVSCIAGPCPFTLIEPLDYSRDGRTIKVTALDWSDTATFLLEAEVDRIMVSRTGRESFPVTFGEALNFAIPVGAEGVTIEAEMNGKPIVFPLGPELLLSWADCNSSMNSDQAMVYRCALKPGYRFQ